MPAVPLYASYILHLVARPALLDNEFARLVTYDEILDRLSDDPLVSCCTLAPDVLPIEDYLSLRPERFDQLTAFAEQGRLEVGAWYIQPAAWMDSLELAIRNLLLGTGSLKILGCRVHVVRLEGHQLPTYPQLPQVLHGFGIHAAVTPLAPEAGFFMGLDGTSLGLFPAHSGEAAAWEAQREAWAAGAAGRHLLAEVAGQPAGWLGCLRELRAVLRSDDVFLSTWAGMTKSGLAALGSPPEAGAIIAQNETIGGVRGIGESPLERLLLEKIEPLAVRSAYETTRLKNPRRIVQSLWRGLLRVLAFDEGEEFWRKRAEKLLALFPSAEMRLCQVEAEAFKLTAIKLREDGGAGVILRGYNPSGRAHWVKLRPWRQFTHCEVVRLDETPTGGALPIVNGEITFMANPHRITTICLR